MLEMEMEMQHRRGMEASMCQFLDVRDLNHSAKPTPALGPDMQPP